MAGRDDVLVVMRVTGRSRRRRRSAVFLFRVAGVGALCSVAIAACGSSGAAAPVAARPSASSGDGSSAAATPPEATPLPTFDLTLPDGNPFAVPTPAPTAVPTPAPTSPSTPVPDPVTVAAPVPTAPPRTAPPATAPPTHSAPAPTAPPATAPPSDQQQTTAVTLVPSGDGWDATPQGTKSSATASWQYPAHQCLVVVVKATGQQVSTACGTNAATVTWDSQPGTAYHITLHPS